MKKVIIMILTIGFICTSGCTKSNNIPNTSNPGSHTNNLIPLTQPSTQSNNPFFFSNRVSKVKYNGSFLIDDIVEKEVILNINKVADLKYGKLYELKLDPIEDVNVPIERFSERLNLGYFYVQKNRIYRIDPTEENLNQLKTSE